MIGARMAIGIAGLLGAIAPTDAFACRCEKPKNASEQIAQTDVAIIGRATNNSGGSLADGMRSVVTDFRVEKTLKGERRRSLRLEQSEASSCRIPYEAGKRYVVLIRFQQGRLATQGCMDAFFPQSDYVRAARNQR